MRFLQPPPEVVPVGLRAMKMVATASQPLSKASANMLAGAQRLLLRSHLDLDRLEPIAPEELASVLVHPGFRRQFIQGMLMLALADGPPSAAQMNLVDAFAAALEVDAPELKTLRLLADEQTLFAKLHFYRHSHLAEVMDRQIQQGGLLQPIKGLLGLRGLYEDPKLAARYHELDALPKGTLGHGLTVYLHENKFAYPGEKGGFPEAGIWHDFGHVLSGYATDPEGELQMAAFQAGYRKNNAFFMLLFGALTFSAGVNVTPLPQPNTHGILAHEGLAERVFEALERGAKLNVDLFDGWDPWEYVALPIEEVRRRIGLE